MRTSKPISTISYNTHDFLVGYLNSLVKMGKVAFWAAILHHGETLDDGMVEKDHFHVHIEPNDRLDTMDLQKMSCEADPKRPDKPLKCMDFQPSKWADWVWYCKHDPLYLASKGESRQYTYNAQDFFASDQDEWELRYQRAMHSSDVSKAQGLQLMLKQTTAAMLAAQGFIAPKDAFSVAQYERLVRRGDQQIKALQALENAQERANIQYGQQMTLAQYFADLGASPMAVGLPGFLGPQATAAEVAERKAWDTRPVSEKPSKNKRKA